MASTGARRRPRAAALLATLVTVLLALALPGIAQAAFPGQSGKIAYSADDGTFNGNNDVYTANPDGSGSVRLTTAAAYDWAPAWSPDGLRLAFTSQRDGNFEIYLMNADGSGQTRLTNVGAQEYDPAWSPDGTKLAFSSNRDGNYEIYVMDADGSDQTRLTTSANWDFGPAWSPDGTKIAFGSYVIGGASQVKVMNADGSGQATLTGGGGPNWSPDGTMLAFSDVTSAHEVECGSAPEDLSVVDVHSINADGSGRTRLTYNTSFPSGVNYSLSPAWSPQGDRLALTGGQSYADPCSESNFSFLSVMNPDGSPGTPPFVNANSNAGEPSWQPVILGSYARPKASSPFRAALVPAYVECSTPSLIHGTPLVHGSCAPPIERSAVVTVGTPELNGAPAKSVSFIRWRVIVGDPATPLDEADVEITISVIDVRCRTSGPSCPGGANSDYEGRLLALPASLRITDRANQPATGGQGSATTAGAQLPIPVDCAPTDDTTIGASCQLTTTADAMLSGAVREGSRAMWEFGQVQVRDPGPNGTGYGAGCPPTCGDGDEVAFLRQGLYAP